MPPCRKTREFAQVMQTQGSASQPGTPGHVVAFPPFSEPHFGNGVGYVYFNKILSNMQPARIYLEFDISDTIFTGILLVGVLFALTWLIYLQEQIDWWFNDL